MEKSRFSLLLLESNESYFEDFLSTLTADAEYTNLNGRLKLCSKSLIFDPEDFHVPLFKILLTQCTIIINNNNTIVITCNQYVKMFSGSRISPYTFCNEKKCFKFDLSYALAEDCLNQILQLHRASTLPPNERNSMIAAICYSRECRYKFDTNWLEDIYDKILVELDASKVSPLVMNAGRVVLSTSVLYFQPFNNAEVLPVLKIRLKQLTTFRKRRFLQRQVGLELFCEDANVSHLYLAFKSQEDRQVLYDALMQHSHLQESLLEPEIMTLKWQNRTISNYEYILYLNSIADRSQNDLTQYPIFPWVLADYTSANLNLDDKKTYRDLSKPLGALNTERLERLKRRRSDMTGISFLYGSHYSAPAFVLFYLIRKKPQLMLCLQNGRFDHPDRIFNSIQSVWHNVLENMSDFKELIPEFYDPSNDGDFLVNNLGLDFGIRHDGHRVHNVQLPPWADDAPDFIRKMRNALESEYVSKNLPSWIDLVFGWRQRGPPAEQVDNVFHPICYEGAVNLDQVSDLNERHALEVQILEFGQIPKQLFQVPHPSRLAGSPLDALLSRSDASLGGSEAVIVANHREHVTCLSVWKDKFVSVGKDGVLKEFYCSTRMQNRSVQIKTAGISACVLFPGGSMVILGTFDNRILVYELDCGKLLDEVVVHDDTVSVLCYNEEAEVLVSGSWDGSVRLWPEITSHTVQGRLKYSQTKRFERDSDITCAAINSSGHLVVYGTKEGLVCVIRTSTSSEILEFQPQTCAISAVTITNNRLITGSIAGFSVHDVSSGLPVFSGSLNAHVLSFAWMDNILLIGTQNGVIESWNLNLVEKVDTTHVAGSFPVSALVVSQCSKYVLSGEGNNVVLRYF